MALLSRLRRRQKTITEISDELALHCTAITGKDTTPKDVENGLRELGKLMAEVKTVLFGSDGQPVQVPQVVSLLTEMLRADAILKIILALHKLPIDMTKDFVRIYTSLMGSDGPTGSTLSKHVGRKPEIVKELVNGFKNADLAVHCGEMLRSTIQHEKLAQLMLSLDVFAVFFGLMEEPDFTCTVDAFMTFKHLIKTHKAAVRDFLAHNYDAIFARYNHILHEGNYVNRRQFLRLLAEMLLDKSYQPVMRRYLQSKDNLILMIKLLRHKHQTIQVEAFHVFKVFVANPNKSPEVLQILIANREKILRFLEAFTAVRSDEQQLDEEKRFLITQIRALQTPPE